MHRDQLSAPNFNAFQTVKLTPAATQIPKPVTIRLRSIHPAVHIKIRSIIYFLKTTLFYRHPGHSEALPTRLSCQFKHGHQCRNHRLRQFCKKLPYPFHSRHPRVQYCSSSTEGRGSCGRLVRRPRLPLYCRLTRYSTLPYTRRVLRRPQYGTCRCSYAHRYPRAIRREVVVGGEAR